MVGVRTGDDVASAGDGWLRRQSNRVYHCVISTLRFVEISFRFAPESGQRPGAQACSKSAISGNGAVQII
jgi:hypothetical protein